MTKYILIGILLGSIAFAMGKPALQYMVTVGQAMESNP